MDVRGHAKCARSRWPTSPKWTKASRDPDVSNWMLEAMPKNPALSPCKGADMKLDANIKGGTWDPVYTCFRKVYVTLCHHRTFNQECLNNGIFPVEARAFATCATVAADDKLREEYVRLLRKASMEITAANI
ncbi:hypothetical protein EMCRGX_G021902 [Ephydatia muelleri]